MPTYATQFPVECKCGRTYTSAKTLKAEGALTVSTGGLPEYVCECGRLIVEDPQGLHAELQKLHESAGWFQAWTTLVVILGALVAVFFWLHSMLPPE